MKPTPDRTPSGSVIIPSRRPLRPVPRYIPPKAVSMYAYADPMEKAFLIAFVLLDLSLGRVRRILGLALRRRK